MLSSWHQLFSTQAEVSATLTGLVFVALSINLEDILKFPDLTGRAGEALCLLMIPVLVGLAGALPQTSPHTFGAEMLGIGAIGWLSTTAIVIRTRTARAHRPALQSALRVVVAEVAVLPGVVAGALLVAGHPGGLWWQAVGTALCILAGVVDAWVLLVEIHR